MSNDKNSINSAQTMIAELVKELGFDHETVPEKFMLLMEEVGEFAKAARKYSDIKTSNDSKKHSLEEEAGDVMWLLLDLCNSMDINLEKSFLEKAEKNRNRKWQ